MIHNVTEQEFINAMAGGNFTSKCAKLLYEYLIELENDTGIDIHLDLITLRCDFREYTSIKQAMNECGYTKDDIKRHVIAKDKGCVMVHL